jgi:hypothetical protein
MRRCDQTNLALHQVGDPSWLGPFLKIPPSLPKSNQSCFALATFRKAIAAWAKSRKFGKAARARSILTRMVEMNKSGEISAKPNTHCYTAVINSCAYSENENLEKRNALQIAVGTYKELVSSDYGNPNHVTFSTLITALRNLSPPSEKRASAVANVFRTCAEGGEVTDLVLRRVQSVLNRDQLSDIFGAAVLQDGCVDINQLPAEWRRNVQPATQGQNGCHARKETSRA